MNRESMSPLSGTWMIKFEHRTKWAFHCHNLYHMAAGVMTEVRYIG